MAFKNIPLTIDTMIRNPVPVEGINQEDNIELNIVVTENKTPKDLSSQIIKVYIRRIDGTLVEQTNQITPTNARKGEVTVKLKNSAFNKEGYALFQLDISDSSGRITSSYATFKIGKGLVSGEAIANTNEIEALKKVEEYIKKANQELETFKQTVAEINENEATRRENEVVRVRKEASRNEAEAIRTQQEATRKEKENERVQAETKRIADEEVRRENEVLRGSEELERKQAEELRKEKELLRIADEKNRKVAESKRIEAESVRVEAEKLRVSAETGRVEAENLRVAAEEKRVAAETKREEGFNKFDGKINANTKELKNARTATTGEEFNSLDERIDCEVDRLNKKIEVSMLQQEDKESHVIENSVEGMTTDMIVKGSTLQNLWKTKSVNNSYWWKIKSDLSNLKNNDTITLIIHGLDLTKYRYRFGTINSESDAQYNVLKDYTQDRIVILNIGNSVNPSPDLPVRDCLWLSLYPLDSTVEISDRAIYSELKIIVLRGDYSNKSIPQYFEGIKSFGEAEKEGNKISILSHNKNLLNTNEFTNNKFLSYVDGTIQELREGRCITEKFYELPQNIVLSSSENLWKGFWIYDSNFNFIRNVENPNDVHVTRQSNEKYYRIGIQELKDSILSKRVQLEEGAIKTTYEPYKEDKKDILLSQYGFDEGLRGLNNTVYDELNDIRRVAVKMVEKYISKNNETITVHTVRNDTISFNYIFNGGTPKGKNNNPNFIANCFATNLACYSNDVEGCFGTSNGFYGSISKAKLESPDIEGITKYIRENFKECYFELAKPVETPLSENINLKTFREKTYVAFENSISGTSSFKAPVDTKATISRLNRENRALEEENKNLRQDFESTTLVLTDSDLELVKQNVDIDFRLMEVEFALDIPQAILSSNINFKKKGEVKSMARTPYAMMKIVILSGDYDREDYIHKVGKYYERGRMTKEEYDELMSLMTADEVIGG